LWLPISVLVVQLGLDTVLPPDTKAWIYNENGPYEILQFFVLLWAMAIAAFTLFKMDRGNKPLMGWILLAFLCCFYVGGEEISWGQQFLNWNTPEYWAQLNDQNETNLHNTSSWLDQKPRLILELAVYTGGIIFPLLRKFKSSALPKKFEVIYPGKALIVTAVICLIIRFADMVGDATHNPIFGRAAELEETYLFYFVTLYLYEMKDRLVGRKAV
jgi:glucan phosphoethanolaminetransferase (alkaline phosphatase superfamily)